MCVWHFLFRETQNHIPNCNNIHDIHDVIFYTEATKITGTSGKITKELVANFATSSGYFWVLPYKRLRHEYHEMSLEVAFQ